MFVFSGPFWVSGSLLFPVFFTLFWSSFGEARPFVLPEVAYPALFSPICQIFPVWFHSTVFRRNCCFRLTTVHENCHRTHYITFQDINLQPHFKIACVKSVLWPVLNSNVVDVSLSGGSLGYWTACNNFKRHCTLPYCVNTALTFIWDPASASMKLRMNQVIFFDWYRILFWNFKICTTSLYRFGWWYTLMKNKHQISLYLGLKKRTTFCRQHFQMDFLLKI